MTTAERGRHRDPAAGRAKRRRDPAAELARPPIPYPKPQADGELFTGPATTVEDAAVVLDQLAGEVTRIAGRMPRRTPFRSQLQAAVEQARGRLRRGRKAS